MVVKEENGKKSVLRIIDANLNRLREALRVIEEYFRFIAGNEALSISLKGLRHSLEVLEKGFEPLELVASRDVASDPFANENRKEEMGRVDAKDVLVASFKRSQEAARVIEEYAKICCSAAFSGKAKTLRFSLYSLEQQCMERLSHEQK
jgi:hypothetical protein